MVVAAIDRLGRRYLKTMWAIYDLQRRGIRLRSLADNEVQWTKYLDADADSPEAFMGNVLASMAAYVASQERQNISRRTMAGLQAARSPGGWHPLVDRPEYSGFMRMSRCAPEDSPVFACAVRCVGPSTGTRGGAVYPPGCWLPLGMFSIGVGIR